MGITITWSVTDGGSALTELAHGSGAAGTTFTALTVFLRHNAVNALTNCKLFIGEKSGTYTGARTASTDLTNLVTWGDGSATSLFGGAQFNFDSVGGFPSSAWPTLSSKSPTNGDTIRTGVGDKSANAISLPTATGAPAVGKIPAGSTTGVSFKFRIQVPSGETFLGKREFDLKLKYTFTS